VKHLPVLLAAVAICFMVLGKFVFTDSNKNLEQKLKAAEQTVHELLRSTDELTQTLGPDEQPGPVPYIALPRARVKTLRDNAGKITSSASKLEKQLRPERREDIWADFVKRNMTLLITILSLLFSCYIYISATTNRQKTLAFSLFSTVVGYWLKP
jgi:hypothetical protein